VTEKVPYQITFRLARTAGGISFGEGRGASTTGVLVSGGEASMMAYSTNPDANPETATFNEFGIFVENRSTADAYINIDSLQLELRKDGQLLSITTRPSITTQPKDIVAAVGNRVVFNSEAAGGALAFQWKKNKVNISGAVNATYVIEESSLDDGGVYSVVVTNPYGEVESSPATLQLKQLVALKTGAKTVEQVIYEEAAVEVKPTLKKLPRIHYPSSLKERGVKGDNVLRFIVTSEGYVDAIQVAKFADSELIEPLMAAYQKARFKPALKNGQPVCVRVSVTIPYPPADK
jgi:TonB family protein